MRKNISELDKEKEGKLFQTGFGQKPFPRLEKIFHSFDKSLI